MAVEKISGTCPYCGKTIKTDVTVPDPEPIIKEVPVNVSDPMELAPKLEADLKPQSTAFIYKLSTDAIGMFIATKARLYAPKCKVVVTPRYCERKRRRDEDMHRSYASLRVAFSEDVLEKRDQNNWYSKIGESGGNIRYVDSRLKDLINKYKYRREYLEEWSKYNRLEELEETLGFTEAFLRDIKKFSTPQRIHVNNGETWIAFAADPLSVIHDMFCNPGTDKMVGRIQIHDVYQVSKEKVEFIVYLYPKDVALQEDSRVRQILMGAAGRKD